MALSNKGALSSGYGEYRHLGLVAVFNQHDERLSFGSRVIRNPARGAAEIERR
jgi:hypothetical protein